MTFEPLVLDEDRNKAEFLREYRTLCERFGLFVIKMHNPDNQYSPFAVAQLESTSRPVLDSSIEEMLIEGVRRTSK